MHSGAERTLGEDLERTEVACGFLRGQIQLTRALALQKCHPILAPGKKVVADSAFAFDRHFRRLALFHRRSRSTLAIYVHGQIAMKDPNPRLSRRISRSGERDRLGRCGRRLADHLFPLLYNSYRCIQAQSEH